MNVSKIIELASKHVNNGSAMESSAQLCLSDAEKLLKKGYNDAAKNMAIKSLKYSVGIMHDDYILATY